VDELTERGSAVNFSEGTKRREWDAMMSDNARASAIVGMVHICKVIADALL
jgi:hypothetical protein